MKRRPRWYERAIDAIVAIAQWAVIPIAALLLLQWPLREVLQRWSREANDLGQLLFALYVAVALAAATRRRAHLATDVLAHRYPARIRNAIERAGYGLALLPWTLFVLVASAPSTWRSLVSLERFPDTYNAGYFVVKAAVWLAAVLLLALALGRAFAPSDEVAQ